MTSLLSTLLTTTILATTLGGVSPNALAGNDSAVRRSLDNWQFQVEQAISAGGAEALSQIEADMRRQIRIKQPTLMLQLLTDVSPGPAPGITIEEGDKLASD